MNGRFARYDSHELRAVYFNGAGYVVRRDLYPWTRFTSAGPVTRQGMSVGIGIRQGTADNAGFACYRTGTRAAPARDELDDMFRNDPGLRNATHLFTAN